MHEMGFEKCIFLKFNVLKFNGYVMLVILMTLRRTEETRGCFGVLKILALAHARAEKWK